MVLCGKVFDGQRARSRNTPPHASQTVECQTLHESKERSFYFLVGYSTYLASSFMVGQSNRNLSRSDSTRIAQATRSQLLRQTTELTWNGHGVFLISESYFGGIDPPPHNATVKALQRVATRSALTVDYTLLTGLKAWNTDLAYSETQLAKPSNSNLVLQAWVWRVV